MVWKIHCFFRSFQGEVNWRLHWCQDTATDTHIPVPPLKMATCLHFIVILTCFALAYPTLPHSIPLMVVILSYSVQHWKWCQLVHQFLLLYHLFKINLALYCVLILTVHTGQHNSHTLELWNQPKKLEGNLMC